MVSIVTHALAVAVGSILGAVVSTAFFNDYKAEIAKLTTYLQTKLEKL